MSLYCLEPFCHLFYITRLCSYFYASFPLHQNKGVTSSKIFYKRAQLIMPNKNHLLLYNFILPPGKSGLWSRSSWSDRISQIYGQRKILCLFYKTTTNQIKRANWSCHFLEHSWNISSFNINLIFNYKYVLFPSYWYWECSDITFSYWENEREFLYLLLIFFRELPFLSERKRYASLE